MKIQFKIISMILFTSLLLSSTYNLSANVDDKPSNIRELDAVSTPPVVIFDVSEIVTLGILTILVYDTEVDLYNVTVARNGVELLQSDISFTWSVENFTVNPPPLSLGNENYENTLDVLDPSSDNMYTGEIVVEDVFIPGEHNDITVEAENDDHRSTIVTLNFCDTINCWGRGGGASTANTPVNTLEEQAGIPILEFDMTGYYCCGYIEPRIIPNGESISNFTVFYNETTNMLVITVLKNDFFYKSAILLDETVDLNLFGCADCSCTIEEPTGTSGYLFVSVLSASVILSTIMYVRKRKRRS